MNNKQNSSPCASALHTTFPVAFISLAALLTLAASPARNQFEQKQDGVGKSGEGQIDPQESVLVEFSASRQRVGGREVAGFSVRQVPMAQAENLTTPVGLNPVEQEAWLAMARRQGASGGMGLASFYPAHYGEPFVVESDGVRVAVRPVGGTDAAAQIDNG